MKVGEGVHPPSEGGPEARFGNGFTYLHYRGQARGEVDRPRVVAASGTHGPTMHCCIATATPGRRRGHQARERDGRRPDGRLDSRGRQRGSQGPSRARGMT